MAKSAISFQWNKSQSVIIRDKGFGKDLYQDIGEIFRRHMYKYVPYSSTDNNPLHLADSSRVTAHEDHVTVTYVKPYARRQYYGYDFQRDLTVHQLATAEWDKACWTQEKSQIGKEVNAARKRHAK